MGGRLAREHQAAGARLAEKLEAEPTAAVPAPFTARPEADGGYVLYFAEPAYMLPTDYFYVWDRAAKRWHLVEAGELR